MFGSEKHKDILIHINDILELKDNNQIEDVEYLLPIQGPEIAAVLLEGDAIEKMSKIPV